MPPERVSLPKALEIFDVERYHYEFRRFDGTVKEKIAKSFRERIHDSPRDRSQIAGAAYQLAVCHALGFGVPFKPQESIQWLEIAAVHGSERAKVALSRFKVAFKDDIEDYEILSKDLLGLNIEEPPASEVREPTDYFQDASPEANVASSVGDEKVVLNDEQLIGAAFRRDYTAIRRLLATGVSGAVRTGDGVGPLHYLFTWDISQARDLGPHLIKAGADVNASASRHAQMRGTPLMWSVYKNCQDHSSILLELGANPAAVDEYGVSALSLAARLHHPAHLKLLFGHMKPVDIEPRILPLIFEAASGESRASRIIRHGSEWHTAPLDTLKTIRAWSAAFDLINFDEMVVAAVNRSLSSVFGASNSDIQMQFLDACHISPKQWSQLLAEAILIDKKTIFDYCILKELDFEQRFKGGKTLLHLCAQNPNNSTTIKYFAERILARSDLDVNVRDTLGHTPFMDALLARKWDLSWLLLHKAGADALATNKDGYSVLGLIIQTQNLGAAKWAFKYSGKGDLFREQGFLVNPEKNISAIQEASRLQLPRAHGMKTEVTGLFLFVMTNFLERDKIDFRSDGILPDGSALDIACLYGNVFAVKALVKKDAHLTSGSTALALIQRELEVLDGEEISLSKKTNLERCKFIVENWENDPDGTEITADRWTKLRTIDESHVKSSWEVVAWEWKEANRRVFYFN